MCVFMWRRRCLTFVVEQAHVWQHEPPLLPHLHPGAVLWETERRQKPPLRRASDWASPHISFIFTSDNPRLTGSGRARRETNWLPLSLDDVGKFCPCYSSTSRRSLLFFLTAFNQPGTGAQFISLTMLASFPVIIAFTCPAICIVNGKPVTNEWTTAI